MEKTPSRAGQRAKALATGAAAILCIAGCAAGPLTSVQPPAPVAGAAGPSTDLVDDRELVVLLNAALPTAPLVAAVRDRGYALRGEERLDALDLHILTLEIPPGVTGPDAIAEVEGIEPAATAGVNHAFRTPPAAPARGLSYVNDMLSWPAKGCVALTPVGLIDTGVDAAAVVGAKVRVETFTEDAPADTRHGTDVASILAAPTRLRRVEIFNAAVVGETEEVGPAAGVDAIVKAVGWLAANDVRVVNVSLAGPYNKILDRGLSAAAARGMILVAAVGNAGSDAPPLYPAALDDVLAVTAIDAAADVYPRAVRGDHVDLAAPGVDVLLDERARFATGTSFAAPIVTSKIAADPRLSQARSVADARRLLSATATDLGAPGVDEVFGAGLIDAPTDCLPPDAGQT